jgi:hypothetical protein
MKFSNSKTQKIVEFCHFKKKITKNKQCWLLTPDSWSSTNIRHHFLYSLTAGLFFLFLKLWSRVELGVQKWCFIGLAYQGKDIVFRSIIEYRSLRDFGP